MKKYSYVFGIDPGVTTGISIWVVDSKQFEIVKSMLIHQAMNYVMFWRQFNIFVRLEDARQRKWFGESGRSQLQGAGSIKRDCKIWEDFLIDNKIPYELVAPKNNKTKIDAELFKKITGWKEQTNEHARDAAMLVFGVNNKFKMK